MLQSTTLTQKWQMTLPKQIREILEIKNPGRILLEVVDIRKKLIKIDQSFDILDLAGTFKPEKKKGILRARAEMEKSYQRF